MTTLLLLLKQLPNLWFLIAKAPAVIAVVRMIIEAVGSEMVQSILEAVKDIIQGDNVLPDNPDKADPVVRQKLLRRIKERIGLAFLNLNETDYYVLQSVKRSRTSDIPGVHQV